MADDFDPRSVFARAWGFTLGRVTAESFDLAAAEAWQLAGDRPYEALHVWQRDLAAVGYRGFEPHVTPAALAAEEALRSHSQTDTLRPPPARAAAPGQLVLDCVLVEPHEWWIGLHRAGGGASCHPGGLLPLSVPADVVSRAYLKMQEALTWSALPVKPGEKFVEIGCSPGGASQCLLDHGLKVIGIDPATVDARVLARPDFTHVRNGGPTCGGASFAESTGWPPI